MAVQRVPAAVRSCGRQHNDCIAPAYIAAQIHNQMRLAHHLPSYGILGHFNLVSVLVKEPVLLSKE